jgi:hypothetical protein
VPGQSIEADGGSSPALRVRCPKCDAHPFRYCVRDDGTTQIIAHKVRRELAARTPNPAAGPGLA